MLPGPAGRLEALLEEPGSGAPSEIALVCHPHPQYGGTMHNKVVFRIARGLRRGGAAVLRFNYRGVHLSEGSYAHGMGELEDARAALAWLRNRYPGIPAMTAGFSFGARIALLLACEDGGLTRVIAAGLPASYQPRLNLWACRIPKIFIQSAHDQFGALEALRPFVESLPDPKELHVISATDHFFHGGLDALEQVCVNVLRPGAGTVSSHSSPEDETPSR